MVYGESDTFLFESSTVSFNLFLCYCFVIISFVIVLLLLVCCNIVLGSQVMQFHFCRLSCRKNE